MEPAKTHSQHSQRTETASQAFNDGLQAGRNFSYAHALLITLVILALIVTVFTLTVRRFMRHS